MLQRAVNSDDVHAISLVREGVVLGALVPVSTADAVVAQLVIQALRARPAEAWVCRAGFPKVAGKAAFVTSSRRSATHSCEPPLVVRLDSRTSEAWSLARGNVSMTAREHVDECVRR